MAAELINKPKYNVRNTVTNIYLTIMFTFFPMFLTESYAHARTDKYWLFMGLTLALLVVVFIITLVYRSENKRMGVREQFMLPLTSTDICMLCFFGLAAVSACLSTHFLDSITGNAGRNNGLILLGLYLIAYFIVSRFFFFKDYVIALYLVFSCGVAMLTILNFYYIDPFGILEGYSADVIEDFGSTIGNKNTIASFMCLFLPVAVMMFVLAKERYLKILSGIAIGIAYGGLICANSNSGYLGFAVILMVMLIFCARDFEKFRNYMLALFILFASGKLLRLFSYLMEDHSKNFEVIPRFLLFSPYMYIPIAFFLIVYLMMTLLRRPMETHYNGKVMKGIFIVLLALSVTGLLGAFLYFTNIDTTTDLGSLEKLFRFDDRWGTHRGFMWINGMKEFSGFDFIHKLFGSGPDTFYYVFEPHFEELLSRFGDSSTDCIHNEFLNYLVTQGIFGLAVYLGLLGCGAFRAIKNSYRDPLTLVFISGALCYAVQSVVNLYQPITTPTLFLFLAISEGIGRKIHHA